MKMGFAGVPGTAETTLFEMRGGSDVPNAGVPSLNEPLLPAASDAPGNVLMLTALMTSSMAPPPASPRTGWHPATAVATTVVASTASTTFRISMAIIVGPRVRHSHPPAVRRSLVVIDRFQGSGAAPP